MLGKRNKIIQIKKVVWRYYQSHKRDVLPWRKTKDPYLVMVSELMLQQTQVARVVDIYTAFIKKFPSVYVLARAPLAQVLIAWKGLGYNRRAKYLHECAKRIVREHKGIFPKDQESLEALPGIGNYTSGAIMAFAYNKPVVCIETNIRTVFLHHFFSGVKRTISDKELLPLIAETLDMRRPREWYWALMDYGSFLKQQGNTVHRKSTHYKKQSTFSGSRREVRGAILKHLTLEKKSRLHDFSTRYDSLLLAEALGSLIAEGFVVKKGSVYQLAE